MIVQAADLDSGIRPRRREWWLTGFLYESVRD
jgi:hypothetical protein